jgi:hypothetical protein
MTNKENLVWYACYGSNICSSSKYWDDGGIAFLDTSKCGRTVGRMYQITEKQFEEIKDMEGSKYDAIVCLGEYEECPVKTFTSSKRLQEKCPSSNYLATIDKGMKQLNLVVLEKK